MDKLTVAQEKTFPSAFGEVTCKIPSLSQRLTIEKRKQRYAEQLLLPQSAWDMIDSMATLDVVVKDGPFKKDDVTGGWNYNELYDEEALVKLGREVIHWIDDFRNSLRREQE